MHYSYKTKGTCAQRIDFDIEDGIVKNIKFLGGCSGNTQGDAKLAEGMKKEDIIERLESIRCGSKPVSYTHLDV